MQIQRLTKIKTKTQRIPSISDVEEIRTNTFLETLKKLSMHDTWESRAAWLKNLLKKKYISIDLAAVLLKMAFERESREMTERD